MCCGINQNPNLKFELKGRKIESPVETEVLLRSNRPALTLMQNNCERGSVDGAQRCYRHHIRCPLWRFRYPCRGQKVMRGILESSGNLQIVLNMRIDGDSTARGAVFGNERFSRTDHADFIYHCHVRNPGDVYMSIVISRELISASSYFHPIRSSENKPCHILVGQLFPSNQLLYSP